MATSNRDPSRVIRNSDRHVESSTMRLCPHSKQMIPRTTCGNGVGGGGGGGDVTIFLCLRNNNTTTSSCNPGIVCTETRVVIQLR